MIKVFDLEGKRVTAITLKLEWNQFARLIIERAPLESEAQLLQEAIGIFDSRFDKEAKIHSQEA